MRGHSLSAISPSVAAAARTFSFRLQWSARRFDSEVGSPPLIAQELRSLALVATTLLDTVGELTGERTDVTVGESEELLDNTLSPELLRLVNEIEFDHVIDVVKRQDRYFGTRRVPDPSGPQILKQLLMTSSLVLYDLVDCSIDLNEIRALCDAIAASLEMFGGDVADPEPDNESRSESRQRVSQDSIEEEALYRWKLGHHIFNILLIFATHALSDCANAAESDECIVHLDRAATIFRGTTSAMWFAEAFPRDLYASCVRPTMIAASGRQSGFSGTDNLDFRLFKIAADDVFERIGGNYGAAREWPRPLWIAAWRFLETRHLDLEHHVLIAEKVVGLRPSIKQVRAMEQMGMPNLANDYPAVDAIRALASMAGRAKEEIV
jgi:hypothetical protein